jgi:hypothetical protein
MTRPAQNCARLSAALKREIAVVDLPAVAARAPVSTLRERLLKLGVWVECSVRRVVLHLPVTFAYRTDWLRIARSVAPCGRSSPAFLCWSRADLDPSREWYVCVLLTRLPHALCQLSLSALRSPLKPHPLIATRQTIVSVRTVTRPFMHKPG